MTVRVVPRGTGSPRAIAPAPTPGVARIPAEVVAATAAGKALIAEAEARAAAVTDAAHAEGLAAGRAEAAALLVALRADEAQRTARLSGLVATAAAAVAERLVGGALRTDDAALTAWATQALSVFSRARRLVVRAHPATAVRLAPGLSRLEAIEILPDPAIELTSLLVTGDLGDARIELPVQIASLLESLGPLLSGELEAHEGQP